jgi:hypothetical protein
VQEGCCNICRRDKLTFNQQPEKNSFVKSLRSQDLVRNEPQPGTRRCAEARMLPEERVYQRGIMVFLRGEKDRVYGLETIEVPERRDSSDSMLHCDQSRLEIGHTVELILRDRGKHALT